MEPIINLLKLGLDGASQRQKLLANNIANISTPGYKRKDIDFISVLKAFASENNPQTGLTMKTTSNKHFKGILPGNPFKNVSMVNTSYRNDDNNVDIDYEMAESVKNSIYYDTLIGQISERFKNLNEVITRGGR